ncbi:MAG: BACON domain-containing protein, partial [bacterium JZ-2024 1]
MKGVRRWFLLALSVACVWLLQGCGGGGGGGPVVSAILLLSTNVLDFQETLSQLTLEVRNGGSATLSWIASPSAPWIQLSVVSGNLAPGQGSIVQVTIDRNQLVPGLNLGNIAVRSNGGNANVTVRATRASDPPPPPPSSLSASQGDFTDSVLIVWSGVTGATGYKVERAESSGGPFTLLATATTENYSDLTATPGKDYWYRVSAVRGTETSVPAGPVNGWRKPVAPENVIASDGSFLDRIQVDWLPVLGASAYRVERATNSAGPFESLTDTHNLPPYFDLTAEPGIYYYYRVSAFVMNHYGQESTVDVGYRGEVPGLLPPENVTASDGTFPNRIGISWFPSPGATYYKVFRADSAGGVLITLADHVTSTSYEDNTVTPGRLYYYRIQAWNDSGASALSAMDSGYAGLEIPAPSGLSASDGLYSDKVRVSWDPVPGATLYLIQRSESATGPFADLSSVSGTTYDDTTATPGIDYFYKVRAFVGSTGGLFGDPDAGWRMPATPADVNASDGTRLDVVEIHWTPVPGAGSYIVERSLSRNADYTEIATTSIASYEDSTAEIAVTYWYRVRTMMHSHNSPASLPDSGYRGIEPPLNFQASDGLSTDGVLLSWEGPDDANFEVQRGPAPLGPFSEVLGVTPVGVKNFTDTTASHGEDYAYRVIARKNFIDSEPSLPDTGWRKPVAPSNLTASDGSSTTGIDLSWDPPSHPATFSVLRAEASGGPFSEIAQGITETTYTDVDAESGKTYFYRVRSVFGSHTSDDSNEDAGYRSLSPPSNVQASDGAYSDRIRVSWDPAPFASGYDVYRSEQPLTGFVKVNMNPVSGITYDDAETSLNISVDYYYQVVSLRGTYSSAPSVTDSGWRAPETPTGVTASDGSFTDRIEVSWNAVPGVDSYKVFRATLSSGPYSEIASGITGTTYIDFSASADIIYYYRVRATQNGRDSADSSIDAGFHGAPYPPNLSASDGTFSDKVRISWDPVPQADSYNLYRADNPLGPYSPLTLNLTVTVNDDTSAQVATDYWYRVTSVRYGVESVQSPEDAGWRAPQAPTGVSASDGSFTDKVQVSWNAVSGATSYKILRATASDGPFSEIATSSSTSYDDTSADAGKNYWYKVRSVQNGKESPDSASDQGWRKPPTPTGVSASDGS